MRHARNERFLVWEGYVYERVGTVEDARLSSGGKPSGYRATESITIGGKLYEKGDELPTGPMLLRGSQNASITGVRFPYTPDFERLARRGLVKRSRLPRRRR